MFELDRRSGFEGSAVRVFYRGQWNHEWPIWPSVFRNENLKENEGKLIKEVVSRFPDEFINDNTTLEKLVRLQHYGLPTRILDLTENSLYALYFACCEGASEKKDGVVFSFVVNRDYCLDFMSDTASVVSNLSYLNSEERVSIREKALNLIKKEKLSGEDVVKFNNDFHMRRLLHFIKEEKPYFEPKIAPKSLHRIVAVNPKMNNRRIIAQSGAFFLFGIQDILKENNDDEISVERITIDGASKLKIIEECEKIGITESRLFPEITSATLEVKRKYESIGR
ncbi:FRG domain-containing protein [Paralimibaculum aggregatum]|uniref:FRG domain-containing protein n=1 Tax=Paralimibaculum aggregatum TaxID=3036245 RepID=UPI0025525253|nr:FRG domain-containing protein [Limibaculum sp. NKW23]